MTMYHVLGFLGGTLIAAPLLTWPRGKVYDLKHRIAMICIGTVILAVGLVLELSE